MQKPDTANSAQKPETNGNQQEDDELISFIVQSSKSEQNQNVENNNVRPPFSPSPTTSGPSTSQTGPDFDSMTNEQIQSYLIAKFQSMPFLNGQAEDDNRQFYQNSNAFPHIPPISSHFSNSDLASLLNNQMKGASGSSDDCGLAQAMSIGHSQNSVYSSQSSSKDSSPDSSSEDGLPYIMPLSHNATLKATGNDGRVRLIVPVSPSESAADVAESQRGPSTSTAGNSLQVPGNGQAPITRTTSEKVPNRSELMAALRAQWTRHTTK